MANKLTSNTGIEGSQVLVCAITALHIFHRSLFHFIFLQIYRFRRRAGHGFDSDNFLLPRGPPDRDHDPPPGHQHGQPPHPGPKKPDDPADPPESPNDPGGMDHYFFFPNSPKVQTQGVFSLTAAASPPGPVPQSTTTRIVTSDPTTVTHGLISGTPTSTTVPSSSVTPSTPSTSFPSSAYPVAVATPYSAAVSNSTSTYSATVPDSTSTSTNDSNNGASTASVTEKARLVNIATITGAILGVIFLLVVVRVLYAVFRRPRRPNTDFGSNYPFSGEAQFQRINSLSPGPSSHTDMGSYTTPVTVPSVVHE